MVVQFLNIATIALRTYIGVTKRVVTFTINKAYLYVFLSWVFAFSGTFIFGLFSDIYLVASGTFCFYTWTSLALLAWAWPIAGIASFSMTYWYWQIYSQMRKVKKFIHDEEGNKENEKIAIRLASLVFLFILGYSGLICQSLYEVFIGRAAIWGDITAACIVLIYWVLAPVAYAHANQRLKISAVLYASPALLKEEYEEISKRASNTLTTIPSVISPRESPSQLSLPENQILSKVLDLLDPNNLTIGDSSPENQILSKHYLEIDNNNIIHTESSIISENSSSQPVGSTSTTINH